MTPDLPPLPATDWLLHMPAAPYEPAWTSSQSGWDEEAMRAYAAEAVRVEHARLLDALADAQTDAKESERLSIIADELIAGFGEPGRALAEMIRQGVTALESHAAHLLRDVRAHTLEEAARVCNPANLIDCPGTYESAAIRKCAAAIRALKPA